MPRYVENIKESLARRVLSCYEDYYKSSKNKIPMDSGYKYNYQKLLGFIATEGAGINIPGDTYLYRLPEIF